MILQEEYTKYIQTAFKNMRSKDDLLHLLNYSKKLVYGEKAIPFEIRNINYNINPKFKGKLYLKFSIQKKSGKERVIHAPVNGLKSVQKCLNLIFQTVYSTSHSATGFVPGKSIVDNARIHAGSLYVFNIDLKDFFPSIDAGRVWGRLQYPPFNLKQKSERKELANIITWLCCHEMEVERFNKETCEWNKIKRSVLPQGAPTSPTLTNIICQQLDFYLNAVAKRFGLKYSRYADDITFSSMHNVYQKDSDFLKEINRIISEQRFHIKDSKTRLQKQGYRQEVTGLLVNEKANVRKRYIKQLRMWLYYWERYGYVRASSYFMESYLADKGNVKKGNPNMANVIRGKLDYLKMVKSGDNRLYLNLKERFESLLLKVTTEESIESRAIAPHQPTVLPGKSEALVYEHSKKIKISIVSLNNLNTQSELQRNIIIKKGEKLPLEEFFENEEKEKGNSKVDELQSEKLIIHDPLTTVRLLNKFTEDTKLKYTTHIWDSNTETGEQIVNRDTFQNDIDFEFRRKYKYQTLEKNGLISLYRIIWNFLVGPNKFGWGRYKLNFGWYNQELKDYYIQNPDKQPGSFIVPEEYLPKSKVDGKYLKYFEDYINVFKREIEFRGNDLYYLFKRHFDFGFEYKIEIDETLGGISFYTDTKLINEAIELIASNIKQRSEKDKHIKIIYSHNQEERINEIKIIDVGSHSNALVTNDKLILSGDKGQIKTIREKLRNLCDFSIESTFNDNGNYRALELIYLSKNRKEFSEDEPQFIKNRIDKIEGFAYKLKFYE